MTRFAALAALVIGLALAGPLFSEPPAPPAKAGAAPAATQPTAFNERLVFIMDNLDRPENIEKDLKIIERAGKAGYTHIVITDCKFFRWKEYEGKGYLEKAQKVRKAIKDAGMKFIAICCDQGSDLISNDPSLAEGTPVIDAPFVVKDGRLVPADEDFKIADADFATTRDSTPASWELIGAKLDPTANGSLLLDNPASAKDGAMAAKQTIKVKPYRYYRLSMMVKTEDFDKIRNFDVGLTGNTCKQGLSHRMYSETLKPTQDWTQIQTTFNTFDNTEVALSIGCYGGGKGKLWIKGIAVEPGGLVNLVRRDALPVKVTSADGKTVYEEGKDLAKVADPKANMDKYPGNHGMWYEQPKVEVLKDGRLKEGDKLLLSYHHSQMSYSWGVFACPSEPKTMELVKWQVQQIHKNLAPDGYMMSHDEIRHWGQDPSCTKTGKTLGQIMAENVRQCFEIITAEDPGKPVYVWSDMFDPTHNAKKNGRPYYLCKGLDPWVGSWEGLDPRINIILWWGGNPKRDESTRFFVGRGNKVILSTAINLMPAWMEESYRAGNGIGTMFTVWDKNYAKMEDFAKMLNDWKPGTVTPTTKASSDLE